MTLQELLKQVEEWDAKIKSDTTDAREDFSEKIRRIQLIQKAAPILAKVVEKLIEQRDNYIYESVRDAPGALPFEIDDDVKFEVGCCNIELDRIIADALKAGEGKGEEG